MTIPSFTFFEIARNPSLFIPYKYHDVIRSHNIVTLVTFMKVYRSSVYVIAVHLQLQKKKSQ
jgi:hypothetical protein